MHLLLCIILFDVNHVFFFLEHRHRGHVGGDFEEHRSASVGVAVVAALPRQLAQGARVVEQAAEGFQSRGRVQAASHATVPVPQGAHLHELVERRLWPHQVPFVASVRHQFIYFGFSNPFISFFI